jgi:hypothetical protein
MIQTLRKAQSVAEVRCGAWYFVEVRDMDEDG